MPAPVLLLASTSPRRKELLQAAGIAFELVAPGPEPDTAGVPAAVALQRARSKAMAAAVDRGRGLPVLGVDTVVDVDGREFGKAADRTAAAAMLQALLGRSHRVHTAHCLFDPATGRAFEEVASAAVHAAVAPPAAVLLYLDSGDWRSKAGAYGIQDPSQDFLRVVNGAFDTVVGLHVAAVRRLLLRFQTGAA
jgi:septum formation protein